ncbi:MAG TPA: GWxTD domain-containing protein [Candidatus Cryosericum sp.]|nr:GWxTD domain-containing protein [Candidatus Cryosericum sp.]
MSIRPALILLLSCALARVASATTDPDYRKPDKDWLKGPVQWLMSDEEAKEFKKLKSDEERQAFAKAFWEKRDPTPGTPGNEYEVIFWERVEQADKAYKDQIRNGSVTALGHVFILLGPPTSQHKDSRYTYWVYEPSPLNGLKEKMEFSFAPVATGLLLRSPKIFEEYVASHAETRGVGWKIPQIVTEAQPGELMAAAAKEPVEDTSPESQRQIPILDAILLKGSGPTDVPFQVTHDFYAAVDGTTLVVATLEAPREAAHGSNDQALLAFARYAPDGGGKPISVTGDLPFVPAADSPSGSFIYQARRNLKPGTYKLAAVVEDKVVKGQMGTLVSTVSVPDYSGKTFGLSSVSLLAQFSRIEAGVDPEGDKGAGLYSIGSFHLVPRASAVLQKSDTLAFYYQVYNPSPDATTGKPSLESTYTFFLKDPTGWKPFRKPVVKPVGQVELFAIDLKDLLKPDQTMPAEFRMEVKVSDKVGGQSTTRELQFTVR